MARPMKTNRNKAFTLRMPGADHALQAVLASWVPYAVEITKGMLQLPSTMKDYAECYERFKVAQPLTDKQTEIHLEDCDYLSRQIAEKRFPTIQYHPLKELMVKMGNASFKTLDHHELMWVIYILKDKNAHLLRHFNNWDKTTDPSIQQEIMDFHKVIFGLHKVLSDKLMLAQIKKESASLEKRKLKNMDIIEGASKNGNEDLRKNQKYRSAFYYFKLNSQRLQAIREGLRFVNGFYSTHRHTIGALAFIDMMQAETTMTAKKVNAFAKGFKYEQIFDDQATLQVLINGVAKPHVPDEIREHLHQLPKTHGLPAYFRQEFVPITKKRQTLKTLLHDVLVEHKDSMKKAFQARLAGVSSTVSELKKHERVLNMPRNQVTLRYLVLNKLDWLEETRNAIISKQVTIDRMQGMLELLDRVAPELVREMKPGQYFNTISPFSDYKAQFTALYQWVEGEMNKRHTWYVNILPDLSRIRRYSGYQHYIRKQERSIAECTNRMELKAIRAELQEKRFKLGIGNTEYLRKKYRLSLRSAAQMLRDRHYMMQVLSQVDQKLATMKQPDKGLTISPADKAPEVSKVRMQHGKAVARYSVHITHTLPSIRSRIPPCYEHRGDGNFVHKPSYKKGKSAYTLSVRRAIARQMAIHYVYYHRIVAGKTGPLHAHLDGDPYMVEWANYYLRVLHCNVHGDPSHSSESKVKQAFNRGIRHARKDLKGIVADIDPTQDEISFKDEAIVKLLRDHTPLQGAPQPITAPPNTPLPRIPEGHGLGS